jgi:hypothetical protein
VAALRPGPTRRKITIYGWSTSWAWVRDTTHDDAALRHRMRGSNRAWSWGALID